MRYLIKETLQINGRTPFMSLLHYLLYVFYRLMLALPSAKAKVRSRKFSIKYFIEHQIDALAH